jgi:hypothetical protein
VECDSLKRKIGTSWWLERDKGKKKLCSTTNGLGRDIVSKTTSLPANFLLVYSASIQLSDQNYSLTGYRNACANPPNFQLKLSFKNITDMMHVGSPLSLLDLGPISS